MKQQKAKFVLIEMMFLFAGESSARQVKTDHLDLVLKMEILP
jgi:hypothetical protein